MRYFVTFDGASVAEAGELQDLELADALAKACRLLDENRGNVVIRDNRNNSISGGDLLACCKGDKEITPDLKAVAMGDND